MFSSKQTPVEKWNGKQRQTNSSRTHQVDALQYLGTKSHQIIFVKLTIILRGIKRLSVTEICDLWCSGVQVGQTQLCHWEKTEKISLYHPAFVCPMNLVSNFFSSY